jgi:hypothetical protein
VRGLKRNSLSDEVIDGKLSDTVQFLAINVSLVAAAAKKTCSGQ